MDNERGFILPLAVLLVLILTISGTGFMHLDYLERRMGMNEVDNHGAFYLANAGIERGRETFNISTIPLSWTSILQNAAITDTTPNPLLCPDLSRGCVIPPFQTPPTGPPIVSPDIPFVVGLFDAGSYTVRAFNNNGLGDSGTIDGDQRITARALGTVRNEQKLLEATIQADYGLKLINCDQATMSDAECKDLDRTSYMENRQPASFPTSSLPSLPPLEDPLHPGECNPANYYCDLSHFTDPTKAPFVNLPRVDLPAGTNLTSHPTSPSDVLIHDNTFYFINGNVSLGAVDPSHDIIIYSLGAIDISAQVDLGNPVTSNPGNAILIAKNGISWNGSNIWIRAPFPYPAIISTGGSVHGNTGINIIGGIYTTGDVDLRGGSYVEGVIIDSGGTVQLRGSTTVSDANNIKYYALMPGFTYDPDLITTATVPGTWKEIK